MTESKRAGLQETDYSNYCKNLSYLPKCFLSKVPKIKGRRQETESMNFMTY